jgi:hypothetical protein
MPLTKSMMKWKETADQRDIQYAAPYAGHDGQDAKYQAEKKEDNGPEPPGFW